MMLTSIEQLHELLFQRIIIPKLDNLKLPPSTTPIINNLQKFIDVNSPVPPNPQEFRIQSLTIIQENLGLFARYPDLTTSVHQYNALKEGFGRLNLSDKSMNNYYLLLIFNSLDYSQLTIDDIKNIFVHLKQNGIIKVYSIIQKLKPRHLLFHVKLFLICLENIVYAPELLKAFQNLLAHGNESSNLINIDTLKLFDKAPHRAEAIANLLWFLWENKLYYPNVNINTFKIQDSLDIIRYLYQHLDNIDSVLTKLIKLSQKNKPLNTAVICDLISQKNSPSFEEINNLMDDHEEALLHLTNTITPLITELTKKNRILNSLLLSDNVQNGMTNNERASIDTRLSSQTIRPLIVQMNDLEKQLKLLSISKHPAITTQVNHIAREKTSFFNHYLPFQAQAIPKLPRKNSI